MHIIQEHFGVLNPPESVFKVNSAQADGFDLGAGKNDARLESIDDVIIKIGLAVFGD